MKLTSQRKFESRLEKAFCFCSDEPDYTPVANASKESAQIMADLGREQLDFAKQQYAENAPLLKEVAQTQMDTMRQTAEQGQDYYDYMVSQQRPVEDALNKDAMAAGGEQAQELAAGKAAADARQGTTSMQNQIIRQGLRYGFSPAKLAAMAGDTAAAQGLSVASAMNQAREKEKSLGYAKKMDVAGLYRGLAGASQGAYGVALNAGNSAGQNAQSAGQTAMAGMAQGTNTIAAGRSMYQSGLSNVLNAQVQSQGQGMDVGSLMGGAASLIALSDRRTKEDIELVGVDATTGLNLYEFNYIGEVERYIGVMADEVEKVRPDAVIEGTDGYKRVNYAVLGIEMKEARNAA